MSRWAPGSTVGIAMSRGVEHLTPSKTKADCKGCGRFDPTTVEGGKTYLRCIKNGCEMNNAGGGKPKRKTKMQKRRKNRRTKRYKR